MLTADGNALCFACRHEWNPAQVVAIPRPTVEPAPTATVDRPPGKLLPDDEHWRDATAETVADVLGPPAGYIPDELARARETIDELDAAAADVDADDAQALLDSMIGGTATLEGGQYARVIDFPDEDHVLVELSGGEQVTVELGDVDRIMPPAPAADPELDAAAEAWKVALAAGVSTMTMLMLKAAVAAVDVDDDGARLGNIPEGFLPSDAEMFPIIETAVVHALASLIITYGIDPAAILASVDAYEASANQGDHETETA